MPFVKLMIGCTPGGWILFVLGPFDANHNNAIILEDCFNRYEDKMNIIQI